MYTYNFAKSVHNIHSTVWCVCMCVHVRSCYSFSQPIHAYISYLKKCICIIMLLSLHSSYAYFLIRELPHDLYYRMWMCVMCAVATSNQITIVPIHSIMCIACVFVRMCVCVTRYLLLHRISHKYYTQLVTCFTRCFCLYIYTQSGK